MYHLFSCTKRYRKTDSIARYTNSYCTHIFQAGYKVTNIYIYIYIYILKEELLHRAHWLEMGCEKESNGGEGGRPGQDLVLQLQAF